MTESESGVLPLHYTSMFFARDTIPHLFQIIKGKFCICAAKHNFFFLFTNYLPMAIDKRKAKEYTNTIV